jgi:hypothetical protein
MALPPNYFFVNPKDGRLVSKSYIQVPGGTSTVPSISFIPSPTSGFSCDTDGKVSIISNGNQNFIVDTSSVSIGVPLSFPLGTAANPSITFTGDPNTGIYSPGADQIGLSSGETSRFVINNTGATYYKTDTNANLYIGEPGNQFAYNGVYINSVYNAATVTWGVNPASGLVRTFYTDALGFLQWTGPGETFVERMRIDPIGRLLVGTSTTRRVGNSGVYWISQIEGIGSNQAWGGQSIVNNSSDIYGGYVVLGKSRGTTPGSFVIVQNNDELGNITFAGADGTDLETIGALIKAEVDGTPGTNDMPGRLIFSTTLDGASTPTERLRIDSNGFASHAGAIGRGAPVTKTGNFSVGIAENWLICNGTGTITVTLPTASAWTGREIMIKTIAAFTVISNASNVVPLAGGAAGTAILAATAGKYATLVSDGTNWIIMQAN